MAGYQWALLFCFAALVLVGLSLARRAAQLAKTRYPREWQALIEDREIMPLQHGLTVLLDPGRMNPHDEDLRKLRTKYRIALVVAILVWIPLAFGPR